MQGTALCKRIVAGAAIIAVLLLPTPTVTGWQEELGQLRSERQEIFERWRDIERTYREWYEGEYGQLE
jgi:hypothetical protein